MQKLQLDVVPNLISLFRPWTTAAFEELLVADRPLHTIALMNFSMAQSIFINESYITVPSTV